jgi:hypothetical protein
MVVSEDRDPKSDFIYHVHKHMCEQTQFGDLKAQILLAVSGVLLSLMLSSVDGRPFRQGVVSVFLYSLCLFFLLTSVLLFLLSLYPRKGPKRSGELTSWDKIAGKKPDDYVEAVRRLDADSILAEISLEIYSLSQIARTKFRIIKWGAIALFIAVVLSVIFWLYLSGVAVVDP